MLQVRFVVQVTIGEYGPYPEVNHIIYLERSADNLLYILNILQLIRMSFFMMVNHIVSTNLVIIKLLLNF